MKDFIKGALLGLGIVVFIFAILFGLYLDKRENEKRENKIASIIQEAYKTGGYILNTKYCVSKFKNQLNLRGTTVSSLKPELMLCIELGKQITNR